MILFTASTQKYELGHIFPVRSGPSRGHLERIADNEPWRQMEECLERARRDNEHARASAYYACQTLEECARYLQSQVTDPMSGEPVGPQEIFYYRIDMPNPTKAVMALVFRGMHHLGHQPEILSQICEEYWRQPVHRWEYFEFLDREARVLEILSPPNEFAIMMAGEGYTNDTIQAKRIWPETRK